MRIPLSASWMTGHSNRPQPTIQEVCACQTKTSNRGQLLRELTSMGDARRYLISAHARNWQEVSTMSGGGQVPTDEAIKEAAERTATRPDTFNYPDDAHDDLTQHAMPTTPPQDRPMLRSSWSVSHDAKSKTTASLTSTSDQCKKLLPKNGSSRV